MALLTVGPNSDFASIAAAMAQAGPGDTLQLETGYSNETTAVTQNNLTIFGDAASLGITLNLDVGVSLVTLTGTAPITLNDASDGNGIVGNAGDNLITVTAGVDAVDSGLGIDRLIVDYRLATGRVTGDSTSNFTEAGGGGRMVAMTSGTIEHFTILTGAGADTITTGDGNDLIRTANGAATIAAGQGANHIVGGADADTITALDGGNFVNAGNGTNTVTTGAGWDVIFTGSGADTIDAGAGSDRITLLGGADTVYSGAGNDLLVVNYSAMTTNVSGGITGGTMSSGYVGHIADLATSLVDFEATENFTVYLGSGDDFIRSGAGEDMLQGAMGNDTLSSAEGNDSLFGGDGDDLLNGGVGDDLLNGGNGTDVAYFLSNTWVQIDLALTGPQHTGLGFDTLRQIENVTSGSGNDQLMGNAAANMLVSGAGYDVLAGGAGNDALYAGADNDSLVGGVGDDFLYGGEGNDSLYAGDGNDRLVGSSGNDFLYGGTGADRFEFAANAQNDRIADFQDGIDHIVITEGAQSFADVTVTAAGVDTVVSFAAVNITLTGVDPALIGAEDFLFG